MFSATTHSQQVILLRGPVKLCKMSILYPFKVGRVWEISIEFVSGFLENEKVPCRMILEHFFIEETLLGTSKLVIRNFFQTTSSDQGGGLGPSPSPWGTPTSARPGTDFRAHFIEQLLLVKNLSFETFSRPPPTIWMEFWGHPHPHGVPQHQQGQGVIFQHTS